MPVQLCAPLLSTRSRGVVFLFVAVLLLIAAAGSAFSAPRAGIKVDRTDTLTAEQRYKGTKEYAARLEQENSLGKARGNWLNCARMFRAIHVSERKGVLGPTSLFMEARTYRRMFDLFRMPQDLESARSSFLELADLYPGHTLADDALFEAAVCAGMTPGKEALASELYRKIITFYPQGDQVEKARAKVSPKKFEPAKPQSPAQATESPAPQHLASLPPVKYWASEDYCRIVLQPAAPVAFTAQVLDQQGDGRLRRLVIDLARSYIAPKLRQPLPVRHGLLKSVRPEQLDDETARVILDLTSLSEYKAFSLTDPFRVVVDIRGGTAVVKEAQSAEAQAPLPVGPQPVQPADKDKRPAVASVLAQPPVVSLTEQKKRPPRVDAATPPPAIKGKSQEKLSLAQQLGLGVRTIVIDPGHGGKDPGAMAFGLKEKDIVLTISKRVAKILKETYRYDVVLTRTKDIFIPLEERTAIANTHKSDLFISIHTNAHSDRSKSGIETYFLNLATDANAMRVAALENATSTHSIGELQDILSTLMQNSKIDESTRLARSVQSNLISGLSGLYKPRDLGVKQAPFYVLIGAEMPAILAEIAFITNPEEARLLQNERYLDAIAAHLAAGIAAYVDHHHTAAITL